MNRDKLMEWLKGPRRQGRIATYWKGDAHGIIGDSMQVQPMLGRSAEGFHPGLKLHGGKEPVLVWGEPMGSLETASETASNAARHWLSARKDARATLAPDAPRSAEEEQRMIGALHEEAHPDAKAVRALRIEQRIDRLLKREAPQASKHGRGMRP